MATRKQPSSGKSTKPGARKALVQRGKARRGARRGASHSETQMRGRALSATVRSPKGAGERTAGSSRASHMNAVAMLKEDHDRVLELLHRFGRARREAQKQSLADRICADLTLHAQIEEEIFYPALREATGEHDLVDEAEVEHGSAKLLIAQIRSGKVGDPQWDARVKVLGEYVRHHIREEQREIFPRARAAKALDLREMGERIARRKHAGPMPEVRATAAAMVGGELGNADANRGRPVAMIESAVRTLLPRTSER